MILSKMLKKSPKKRKILLVDDEPNILMVVGEYLRHKGFEVIEANNGQECIDKAESEMPDIILLDNMMPVMDGLTAIRNLKNLEKTKDIPIIMVTAFADKENMDRARQDGVIAFVAKPFDYAVLLKKITHK
jgi:CheY-like chemotaxis protein